MQAFFLSNWLKPVKSRLIRAPTPHPGLDRLAQIPEKNLPRFVQECPVASRYLSLLGQLGWSRFPESPERCRRHLDIIW